MSDDTTYEKGLEVRRSVLGAEYVDQSIAKADDFNSELQRIVTTYCWGEIWTASGALQARALPR